MYFRVRPFWGPPNTSQTGWGVENNLLPRHFATLHKWGTITKEAGILMGRAQKSLPLWGADLNLERITAFYLKSIWQLGLNFVVAGVSWTPPRRAKSGHREHWEWLCDMCFRGCLCLLLRLSFHSIIPKPPVVFCYASVGLWKVKVCGGEVFMPATEW